MPKRGLPHLRILASAAAVVTLAAGALLIPLGGCESATSPAAAAQLGTSDGSVAPGQYRYVEVRRWTTMSTSLPAKNGFPFRYLTESTTKTWIPADQTTEWLQRFETSGEYRWLNGNDEEYWAAFHEPVGGMNVAPLETTATCGDFNLARGKARCAGQGPYPTRAVFAGLPRDPAQLYDWLRDNAGHNLPAPHAVLDHVSRLLQTGLVPPDLRTAMYQALTFVPGLEITEHADLDGLRGTAYGLTTDDGERYDVVIDPETGQYLGEHKILEKPWEGIPAGTVTHHSAIYTAIADERGQTPTG